LAGGKTDGAADAQEVNVPAPDEQRVRNTHEARITCNKPGCPGSVRHVDGALGHVRRHTRGNMAGPPGYSRCASALAEPGEGRLGLGGGSRLGRRVLRQVLAVAPGATRALLMVPLPARNADHVSIVRRHLCISSRYGGKPRTCTGAST